MSLARIALRIAAVEAVRGRTLVGENVLDSDIGALEVNGAGGLHTSEEEKFIAVYTDAAKAIGGDLELRELVANGETELLFEMGVTAAMVETNDKGESVITGIGLPPTDQALEFALDLAARQIMDALTDPQNAWAEVFRGLCHRFVSVERVRTGNIDDGVRLAGQQIKIKLHLIDDPLRGVPLVEGDPFERFLALADGEPRLSAMAALMRGAITGEQEPWEALQRRFGMTADELLALGLGPLAADADRQAPPMASGTLDLVGMMPAREVRDDG